MQVTIQGIQFMGDIRHYMADGQAIAYSNIKGSPNVGDMLERRIDHWVIIGVSNDSDCPNGVCPIK